MPGSEAETSDIAAIVAKQHITDALLRFTRGIDRRDEQLMRSAFHPDAVDNHGPFVGPIEEFFPWALSVLATFEVSQHRISNIQIELLGDRANVETYLLALHVTKSPRREELVFGRYIDLFEKRAGSWKIANRMVVIDHSATRDCSEAYEDQAKYRAPGVGRSDPVFTHRWP